MSLSDKRIYENFYSMMLGNIVGTGMSRHVYDIPLLPDLVVKVEGRSEKSRRQNVMEWLVWERVQHSPMAKWFAPCVSISTDGLVLLQKKTTVPLPKQYPNLMPAFLSDFKRTNYGMLGKQIVCHDYGLNLIMEEGMTKRMRRAEWWNQEDE